MCGIAGAIGAIDPSVVEAVERMTFAQRHRGPDGEDYWSSSSATQGPYRGCAFGFRRLAILDLREIAMQPMLDRRTGNALVFNGEIYNYRSLREELALLGHRFETRGDSEVLLKAYGQWGSSCLDRLRGMFAFAIWDEARGTVLIARDRLGIKPCYFSAETQGRQNLVLFASEVRALLSSELVAPVIDDQAVSSYLWHGFVAGDRSLVAGVESLAPGHWIEVDARKGKIVARERYWTAPLSMSEGTGAIDPNAAGEILRESVELRLASDVPVGVFLSGGVDSSVVAASAVRSGPRIRSFTVGFEEKTYDESDHAEAFARQIGSDHTTRRVSQSDFATLLPEALEMMDQPTLDGINSFLVSRLVREEGVKVALSGTGGDELFGGYDRFRRIAQIVRFARPTHPALAGVSRNLERLIRSVLLPRIDPLRGFLDHIKPLDGIVHGGDPVAVYQLQVATFRGLILDRLHTREPDSELHYGLTARELESLRSQVADAPLLSVIGHLELHSFLSQRILRDADSASMAVSLELRVPLLDHLLVEALASYGANERYRPVGEKTLLKSLGLTPEQIATLNRPKSGFRVPLEEWASDSLSGQLAEVLRDAALATTVGLDPKTLAQLLGFNTRANARLALPRLWAIFALMNWCRMHGMRSR